MIRFLFPSLTNAHGGARGQAMFDLAVRETRQAHWFTTGGVEDDVDGRFAVLATVVALILVRLERRGPDGAINSVALTERFVEAMDAEHRQLGVSDPALGRTVRKLVGSLERRLDLWRNATDEGGDWRSAARASLLPALAEPKEGAVERSADALRGLWSRLQDTPDEMLARGELA